MIQIFGIDFIILTNFVKLLTNALLLHIIEFFGSNKECTNHSRETEKERYCGAQLTSRFNKVLESPYVTISRTKCCASERENPLALPVSPERVPAIVVEEANALQQVTL